MCIRNEMQWQRLCEGERERKGKRGEHGNVT